MSFNWTQLLLKGRYPLFILYSIMDGETANFIGSTLAGNKIFNIFIIYTLNIIMELTLDITYYSIGRKIPLQKALDKLIKTQKGRNFVKKIDSIYLSKPYVAAFITKFLGPLSIPGLIYFGNRQILKPRQFILASLAIAIPKGIIISFLGYMVGRGIEVFRGIYGTVQVVVVACIIIAIGYTLIKLFPKLFDKDVKKA